MDADQGLCKGFVLPQGQELPSTVQFTSQKPKEPKKGMLATANRFGRKQVKAFWNAAPRGGGGVRRILPRKKDYQVNSVFLPVRGQT